MYCGHAICRSFLELISNAGAESCRTARGLPLPESVTYATPEAARATRGTGPASRRGLPRNTPKVSICLAIDSKDFGHLPKQAFPTNSRTDGRAFPVMPQHGAGRHAGACGRARSMVPVGRGARRLCDHFWPPRKCLGSGLHSRLIAITRRLLRGRLPIGTPSGTCQSG